MPLAGEVLSRLAAGELVSVTLPLSTQQGQQSEQVVALQLMLLNVGATTAQRVCRLLAFVSHAEGLPADDLDESVLSRSSNSAHQASEQASYCGAAACELWPAF